MNAVTDWLMQQESQTEEFKCIPFEAKCFLLEYLREDATRKRIQRVAVAQYVSRLVDRDMSPNAASEAAAIAHNVGVTTAREYYQAYGDIEEWL